MTLTSTVAKSANLPPMPKVEDQEPEKWISPIGQSIDEFIAEQEQLHPELKKELAQATQQLGGKRARDEDVLV